ncbi:GAF domain-containing protein [Planktothrix sp. FACHB-1365]|uniref:GAF domain-containing protein n=1 Tax=Planktothrix sp. FACHB-1365 TaxID=2692855 RepID=UPI001688FB88|nr:GAF domain-containing protein [Planktothrix sp. FACHB-1365]MBD2483600.1 PAS domain S-box protein [Planktothrix sp. FACHB-1365]
MNYLGVRFNITALKLAEKTLEQQLQVFDAAIDGIAIIKADNYIYVNPSHLNLFGYEKSEDLIGKSWRLLYSQQQIERFEQEIFPRLRSDRFWQGEMIANRQDGSTFDQELSLTITDEGLWICVCHDLSDHPKIKTELAKSEALFRGLVEGSSDLIWSCDLDGKFIYLSPQFETFFGWEASEWIGKSFLDLVHPDDREIMDKDYPQKRDNLEFRHLHRDGHYLWVKVNATAIKNKQGKIVGTQGILSDISKRKASEQVLNQQVQREKLLRKITQRIRQSLDLQSIFQTACQEIRSLIEADRVSIFKFYPESNFDDGEMVAESVVAAFPSVMTIPIHDHCFGEKYSHLYAKGKYQAVGDIYNSGMSPCHIEVLAQFQIRANLVIPLLCGNDLWGLLCIHQCATIRHWQQSEIEYIQQIAHQLTIAIQQASLYQQLQCELLVRQKVEKLIAQQLLQQQVLANINQQIRESLDINQILAKVTEHVKNILDCDRVIVFQLFADGRSQIVEELVSDQFVTLKNCQWQNEVWSQEILDYYWQGLPRIVPDVMNDIWTDCLMEYNITGQIQSKIVAPILQEAIKNDQHRWIDPKNISRLWGILVVHACQEKRVWQKSQAQLLQQIANQLAIAIQQASLFDRLEQELNERKISQQQLIESNQELAISNEQLARATRLKDEFLANMSHELRTPLNAILGMSEALAEEIFGPLNEKQQQAIETIASSGTHLLSLINDILDVAKIESGKIELESAPTSINELCESSLLFIKQQALQKRLQIQTEIPPNLPDLFVDQRRIRQVLINLLNNAVKFTSAGGRVSLTVKVEFPTETDFRSPSICFAVSDNGIGITPENQDKLFKPFVQIDSALNRQYAGTGLGLVLVKRIVEMHGGQLEVESTIGVGSCFSFRLPYQQLPSPIPKSSSPQSSNLDGGKNPITQVLETSPVILLAEDHEANIITISRYLKAKGYTILLARNGQEAIDIAKSQSPDLILMDISMPGIDGLEAIKHLRQDSDPRLAKIPIIALTALAMKSDQEKCLEAGANGYLTKPVKLNQLTSTIQQILVKGSINEFI